MKFTSSDNNNGDPEILESLSEAKSNFAKTIPCRQSKGKNLEDCSGLL